MRHNQGVRDTPALRCPFIHQLEKYLCDYQLELNFIDLILWSSNSKHQHLESKQVIYFSTGCCVEYFLQSL